MIFRFINVNENQSEKRPIYSVVGRVIVTSIFEHNAAVSDAIDTIYRSPL